MFLKKKIFKTGNIDFLIVGLGNPESKYDGTRHNIGFRALDTLAEDMGVGFTKMKFKSILTECDIGDSRCLLCKPQTYMNNSGEAVTEIMRFYKLEPQQVIVVFDDVSLDVGRLRIRRDGSHGGHNGIRSIIDLSGSNAFPRVKIGVGKKPHPDYDLAAWVLGKFDKADADTLNKVIDNAVAAVKVMVKSGVDSAMSKYNH